MRKKKDSIKFVGRKHSKKGMIATVIGVAIIILLVVLSVLSGIAKGQGSLMLGVAAILGFFMAIAGFVLSVSALKEKDVFYVAPILGTILNGMMFIVFMVLYIIGLF